MKMGRVLGIIGGILVLLGSILSWADVSGGTLVGTLSVSGLLAGGMLSLIFGILGLIMVAIPKKVTAILGLIFGILALLWLLLAFIGPNAFAQTWGARGTSVTITIGFGIYVAMIGAILLVLGSGIAIKDAGAKPAPPIQAPM